jgi:hypothetical protein
MHNSMDEREEKDLKWTGGITVMDWGELLLEPGIFL